MSTLNQDIDYLRKQLGIRDSQVLNDLLNSYSNAQISLQNQLVKQQERIDKAIEYIEHNSLFEENEGKDVEYSVANDNKATKELLSILRGEDNE